MTTSITYLPTVGPDTSCWNMPKESSFEEALKEVEWAHRSLLMDRLAAQTRVQEALDAAEQLEKEAQRRLDKALLTFSFAGGEGLDLNEVEWGADLAARLADVLQDVSHPLLVEFPA